MVDRRRFLTVSAGAALGTVALADAAAAGTGVAADAMAGARAAAEPVKGGAWIPRTLSAVRSATRGRMRVPEADFPLTHLGVRWRGHGAWVRVRTAGGWTASRVLHGCGGRPDGSAEPGGSALLVVPGAVGYEVAVAGDGAVQVTELNTVDGPTMTAAATVANSMPLPDGTSCDVPYLSRAAWGADESLRFRDGTEYWPPEFYPVQTLTVHHTAGANDDPDPAATVRAIYYYQAVTQDWGDIGYHLLVDEAGRVYEGRWSGPDGVPVFDGTANGRPLGVTAAHVGGFNTGNLSVCLLGDFTSRLPTTAAWESTVRVLAGLARVCGLDPLGTTDYVNPVNSATKTVQTISGHRDWAATQCPGNMFYPHLPTVRSQVAGLLAVVPRKPPGSTPRPPVPRR